MAAFSLPLPPSLFPVPGLLHGNYVDDALVVGAILYLLVMLVLARFRANQIKRKRAEKAAQKRKTLPADAEEGPNPDNPVNF